MKPHRIITPLITLAAVFFLCGCAQYATVSVTKPDLLPAAPAASADRLAQQIIHRALRDERREPLVGLGSLVEAAATAAQQLDRDPADAEARRDYNFAVARICDTLREAKLTPWTAPIHLGARTLTWMPHPRPVWNPALYDLIPTDELKITGTYFDVRETRPGLGAPVVAKRIADQLHDYAPTPHFYYAATMIARFEGTRCVLAIEDPLEDETVRVGRRTFPLAAGFTSPLAMMLVEMKPKKLELPRLLHPAKFAATTRIARLEPYDPNKTVVLVVHGLMDSPATWFPLINHLRADEEIRKRYQFWLFSYPSGYPYSYSAAILRRELDEAEKRYPLKKKMVVIGHSMGGCVTRVLVTDSGNHIWNHMFSVPPEQIEATPEYKHILTESTIFQRRKEIGVVIFISTPHRGSDLAVNWIGRIGSSLVRAPAILLKAGRETMRFRKKTAGEMHLKRFPDSVDTLAPNNSFVVAINQIPISADVPYHSIIGDRGRGDTPKSSDGVVPYWSSHLDGAQSEKIVPYSHPAHQHPEAISEVKHILIQYSK